VPNDHYVPQTYLAGFIHPGERTHGKALHVFHRLRNRWERKSTRQVCYFPGLESHSDPQITQTLSKVLWSGENHWPTVREGVRAYGYRQWRKQLDPLLRFAAYLSLRSPLFRLRFLAKHALPVVDLNDKCNQDAALEAVLQEALALLGLLNGLEWSLHVASTVDLPVMTSDHPLVLTDLAFERRGFDVAIAKGNYAITFPIAWDCCLVGAKQQGRESIVPLGAESTLQLWHATASTAFEVVISPVELELPQRPPGG